MDDGGEQDLTDGEGDLAVGLLHEPGHDLRGGEFQC